MSKVKNSELTRKEFKLYYYNSDKNFGDICNPILIESLFNCKAIDATWHDGECFAIGSILQKLTEKRWSIKGRITQYIKPPITVWGSGFIRETNSSNIFTRKLNILALRGKLSQNIIQNITKKNINVPLGDPGLLLGKLINKPISKTVKIGIIPHFIEMNAPEIDTLQKMIPNSKKISIIGEPMEILHEIAQCETIISSSLHGLIAADSLGIPNIRLINNELKGGHFKFNDYYSAFGIENHSYITMDKIMQTPIDENFIRENYMINFDTVKDIQKEIFEAGKSYFR